MAILIPPLQAMSYDGQDRTFHLPQAVHNELVNPEHKQRFYVEGEGIVLACGTFIFHDVASRATWKNLSEVPADKICKNCLGACIAIDVPGGGTPAEELDSVSTVATLKRRKRSFPSESGLVVGHFPS